MERQEESGFDRVQNSPISEVKVCIQCGRCSSGCLGAFHSKDTPRKLIRLLQWGLRKDATNSPLLRLCIQCTKCTECCPAGVDVAGVIRELIRNRFKRGW